MKRSKPKVLIIDDEEGIRKFMQRVLGTAYELTLAGDGKEGLRQAARVMPNLILLDLHLPDVDGLSVLAKLKAVPQTNRIPVVIVSIDGETVLLLEGQQAGAVDHLVKPFEAEQLRDVVQRNILPDAPETPIQAMGPLSSVVAPATAKSVILLIEDEEAIRKLMKRALEASYEVSVTGDGQEGVSQAKRLKPQLIFLDLRMPGMDGLAVLAKLKAMPETRAIPVVIVSVHGETEMLLEGQQAGAVDHIIKPFAIEELRAVAARHLSAQHR